MTHQNIVDSLLYKIIIVSSISDTIAGGVDGGGGSSDEDEENGAGGDDFLNTPTATALMELGDNHTLHNDYHTIQRELEERNAQRDEFLLKIKVGNDIPLLRLLA